MCRRSRSLKSRWAAVASLVAALELPQSHVVDDEQ